MADIAEARKLIHTEQGRRWLVQFEPLDKELAAAIANNLTLVSHTEFQRNLLQQLENLASSIEGNVGLYAIRELKFFEDAHGMKTSVIPFFSQATSVDGKSVNALSDTADQGSEAIVANIIRQLCKTNPEKYLNHPTKEELRNKKCDAIIFVDDFIGSGGRVSEFLQSFWFEPTIVSWLSGKQLKGLHVVAYSGTEDGVVYVSRHKSKPTVHLYRDAPTFEDLFWPETKQKQARNLCEKYGRIANKKRKNMWFGYKEGMATMVFEHGCPNNTPAMLWEPDFSGSGWIGLFPNRTVPSEVMSVFPKEIVGGDPIQILENFGQQKLAKSGALLRRGITGQVILVMLGLIARGTRKRTTLSFATGLNIKECERVIAKCIDWGFISAQKRITPRGLAELNAARKSRKVVFAPLERGSDYYYPRQLRGTTHV